MNNKRTLNIDFEDLFTEKNTIKYLEYFKGKPNGIVEIVIYVPISVINGERVTGMRDFYGTNIPISMSIDYGVLRSRALTDLEEDYTEEEVTVKICQLALEAQCDVVQNLFIIH